MISFLLNDRLVQTDRAPGTVVLDYVRYDRRLTGTKIGCREGDCGACTVLVGEMKDGRLQYQSMTSCLMPLANAQGKHIVTVEGINLSDNQESLSPAQACVVDEGGTQCGFCTPGFIMSMTGFCLSEKAPTYPNAIAAMDGNICRCTGYKSLERAAAGLSEQLQEKPSENSLNWLVQKKFLPEYFESIPERLRALQEEASCGNPTQESGQVLMGGGTDLFVQRPEAMAQSAVHPLYGRQELKGIWRDNGSVYIGGGATVEELRESVLMREIVPDVMKFTKLVSSTPIRNMATVAGNFVNASPIGDLTIFFLALDATLALDLNGQKREVKLREFYKGYKTLDRQPGEQVVALHFEVPSSDSRFNFEKVSKRTHLDIASVNTAVMIQASGGIITKAHLSAGGVGPIPKYLANTSAFLAGKDLSEQTLSEAANLIQEEISPISDARGTEAYKRLLLRQLFYGHFISLFPEVVGESVFS